MYLSVVVLLSAVLRQGPTPWRLDALHRAVGADRRTLQRWRHWWTQRLGRSRQFEIGRAQFMPPPHAAALPRSLLQCFAGAASERVFRALLWLTQLFGSRFPTGAQGHAEVAR